MLLLLFTVTFVYNVVVYNFLLLINPFRKTTSQTSYITVSAETKLSPQSPTLSRNGGVVTVTKNRDEPDAVFSEIDTQVSETTFSSS